MNSKKHIHSTARNGSKLSDRHKEALFAEFSSLLSSGVDFMRALSLMIDTQKESTQRDTLRSLIKDIVGGRMMCESMERVGCFASIDTGVVRIGETTGRLVESLEFLADYYNKRIAQRRMISSAVSYPIVVMCTAVAVVAFMMIVVVPMFEQVYLRMGGELPRVTQLVISFSRAFPFVLLIVGLIAALVWVFLYARRDDERVRAAKASLILSLPIVGGIVRCTVQANFCRLLHLTVSSGVPILESLSLMEGIITFYPYRCSIVAIGNALRRGEFFAENLTKYPRLYDKKLTTLVAIGEQTNSLPAMLLKYGQALGSDLEFSIKRMGSILEPVLILFIGCLVAVVLISMYMPMFSLGGVIH